jgi:hypothetical protein
MIANSTDEAMINHPMPIGLLDVMDATWGSHAEVVGNFCDMYIGAALQVCACSLPWDIMTQEDGTAFDNLPNCGCGYTDSNSNLEGKGECFTGGNTILVFFSILVGGMGLGQSK